MDGCGQVKQSWPLFASAGLVTSSMMRLRTHQKKVAVSQALSVEMKHLKRHNSLIPVIPLRILEWKFGVLYSQPSIDLPLLAKQAYLLYTCRTLTHCEPQYLYKPPDLITYSTLHNSIPPTLLSTHSLASRIPLDVLI